MLGYRDWWKYAYRIDQLDRYRALYIDQDQIARHIQLDAK